MHLGSGDELLSSAGVSDCFKPTVNSSFQIKIKSKPTGFYRPVGGGRGPVAKREWRTTRPRGGRGQQIRLGELLSDDRLCGAVFAAA
jgi:hypothetical protein